jgi:twinkle protein
MKPISDDIDFLKFAGLQESQFIEPTKSFIEEVKKRFEHGFQVSGERLPWASTFERVRLRQGEVSLWAGVNGHGKSLVLGQILLWLPREIKILIASLEMQPAATIERMVKQALGDSNPSDKFIDEFADLTDNMFIYDQTDTVQPNRILGMVHYAAQELGIQHIMIDSLVKCGISPDDYSKQKEFVDRLCWAAKNENIHIHLVHHMRKGNKEGDAPDKFDIKGAGEITDLVDNVFIVHRNKNKERARELGEDYKNETPDGTITVAKQRHGEWEGRIGLYFHKQSTQYLNGSQAYPLRWRE